MALRALMLKKELDTKRKAYKELLKRDAEFEARNAELEQAIEEAETDEQKEVVNEAIDTYETEIAEHETAKTNLDDEIRKIESDLADIEDKQGEPEPAPTGDEDTPPAPENERKENTRMNTREFYGMNIQERTQFFAREDVQSFLTEVRTCIREKRALSNVGLTIPEVMLGHIR